MALELEDLRLGLSIGRLGMALEGPWIACETGGYPYTLLFFHSQAANICVWSN